MRHLRRPFRVQLQLHDSDRDPHSSHGIVAAVWIGVVLLVVQTSDGAGLVEEEEDGDTAIGFLAKQGMPESLRSKMGRNGKMGVTQRHVYEGVKDKRR